MYGSLYWHYNKDCWDCDRKQQTWLLLLLVSSDIVIDGANTREQQQVSQMSPLWKIPDFWEHTYICNLERNPGKMSQHISFNANSTLQTPNYLVLRVHTLSWTMDVCGKGGGVRVRCVLKKTFFPKIIYIVVFNLNNKTHNKSGPH